MTSIQLPDTARLNLIKSEHSFFKIVNFDKILWNVLFEPQKSYFLGVYARDRDRDRDIYFLELTTVIPGFLKDISSLKKTAT